MSDASLFPEEENPGQRRILSKDMLSLSDADPSDYCIEDQILGNINYCYIIRELTDIDLKFVALAMEHGFQKNEIAFMMEVHPSTVTRMHQQIKDILYAFKRIRMTTVSGTVTRKVVAIKNFLEIINYNPATLPVK